LTELFEKIVVFKEKRLLISYFELRFWRSPNCYGPRNAIVSFCRHNNNGRWSTYAFTG